MDLPNSYRKQQQHGKGDGKELCDLLVVCGDDIIIFSDKSVAWSATASVDIGWKRWYRKAIHSSLQQNRGAERWLREFPERIFLDKGCIAPLPIELPPVERRRIHGIVIAVGATEACKNYFNDPAGMFMISSEQRGEDHNYQPFLIGDIDPNGPFVHVFDRPGTDLLLKLLDTITDFTIYLERRARAIRGGRIISASDEADLVAYYMANIGPDGEHDFVHPQNREWRPQETLIVTPGYYKEVINEAGFIRKIKADKISYAWDRLITQFSDNVVAGTSVSVLGEVPTPASAERALRAMARERRVHRRLLGEQVITAYREMIRHKMPRFARIMMPSQTSIDKSCAYILMILAYPDDIELENGYQQYREARVRMLEVYCLALMSRHRDLEAVVGIGVDAPSEMTGREGGSEDLVFVGKQEWSPEFAAEVEKRRLEYSILESYRGSARQVSVDEYPGSADDARALERAQAKRDRKRMARLRSMDGFGRSSSP